MMIATKKPVAWVLSCLAVMLLAASTDVSDAGVALSENGVASHESLPPMSYREMLEELVASAVACDASSWLLADMRMPALYTKIEGVCTPVNPGTGQARYFSDRACARKIDFRATSYSGYCREMVAVGSNMRLGNAASWSADEGQVNDPAPG